MRWKTMLGSAAGVLLCVALSARAQYLPPPPPLPPVYVDDSLGSLNTGKIEPVDRVDGPTYEITDDWGVFSEGHETRFHSFSRFDIYEGQIAEFSSDYLPSRVIARMVEPEETPGWSSGSEIYGTLRCTIPGADLILLNPRGIFFAYDAKLDVQGSFYASTADVLRFADGIDFDARIAAAPGSLSTAAPSAFGFTSARPGTIRVASLSKSLGVPEGKMLSFVGGEFEMVSPSDEGPTIAAPGARVQIVAAGGPAEVPVGDLAEFDPADLPRPVDYDPQYGSCGSCGAVTFYHGAAVDVSTPYVGDDAPAGSIVIRGGRFQLDESRLVARNIQHGEDAVDATGPIDVAVNGELEIGDESELLAITEVEGRGGDVRLSGESVSVSGLSSVTVGSNGPGESGDLWIEAVENTEAPAGASVSSSPDGPGSGEVWVTDDAKVLSKPQGAGAGGDIAVSAKTLKVSSGGDITMQVDGAGEGPVADGKIDIDVAETLVVEGGAQIATVNHSANGSRGNGGIEIDADTIAVRGFGQIVSRSDGLGAGGPIVLTTAALEVSDAGRVQSEASAKGAGGPIEIHADSVLVSNETDRAEGTFIGTNTMLRGKGSGDGGDLTLYTKTLDLVHGGQLFAQTEGSGDAGTLHVLGPYSEQPLADSEHPLADYVHLSGVAHPSEFDAENQPSGITARATETATKGASGGSIIIETRILEADNGAQISAATFGAGSASDLTITAESVTIQGGEEGATVVSAASRAVGNPPSLGASGNLTIDAQTVALRDGGQVSVSTAGRRNAGNIEIIADNVSISGVAPGVENPSGVFAQTNAQNVPEGGAGGDITIEAENLRIADRGRVSVSAEPFTDGDAGLITLEVGQKLELASGGAISARSEAYTTGQGGSIAITAGERVSLKGGSEISARAYGSGNAGRIDIDAGHKFESWNSSVTSEALDSSGGEITIQALEGLLLVDSDVTTSVQAGVEGAGNITIDPELVVLDDSRIIAQAYGGPGGAISITAGAFVASSDSEVDASSELGIDGVVEINAPEVVLAGELATLPESFLDASALLASACEARTARAGSFVVQRRAAIPAPPDATLSLAAAGLPAVGAAPELPQCPLGEEAP